MTIDRETVIRLAKECTAPEWQEETQGWHMCMDYLKFAAMVLEHGRKPLIAQIKEDEALMLMALDALSIAATWMPLNHRIDRVDSPIESLRQRLEAKK